MNYLNRKFKLKTFKLYSIIVIVNCPPLFLNYVLVSKISPILERKMLSSFA